MGIVRSIYDLDLSDAIEGLKSLHKNTEELHQALAKSSQSGKDAFKGFNEASNQYNKRLMEGIRANEKVASSSKSLKNELAKVDKVYEDLIRDQAKFIASGDYGGLKKKIEEVADRQKQLRGEMDQTGKSAGMMGGLAGKAAGMLAGLFAIDKAIRFGEQILEVTGEFEKLRAVLTNTLGSEVAAGKALEDIALFAAKTPFSVREIAAEFTKLANRDITPTIAQLTKMGDVAGTLGKPLGDVNEAILDVSNTERWNELGIKVKSNGDKMSGTFRGLTVEVAKTEKGALEMIQRFGELPGVAGQMAAVSNTLTGQISNLGDSFDQFLLVIGNGGSGVFKDFISGVNTVLQSATSLLSKTQQEKNAIQLESAQKNLEEGKSAEALLNRYKALTRDGIELNASERKELNGISLQLGETFGRENVQLDENTGLWKVNVGAIEAAIKQRFLLANQEASSLALRAKAIEGQRAAIQQEIDFADATVQEIESKIGLSGSKLINQLTFALSQRLDKSVIAERFGISEAQIDFAKANIGKLGQLAGTLDKQNKEQLRLSEEYVQIFDKLKNDFGFSEEEFTKLFNPEPVKETTKATADNSKEVEKLRETYRKLINDLAFNLADAKINFTAALFGDDDPDVITRRALNAKDRLIDQFESAQKEIEDAGKKAGMSRAEINVRLNLLTEDYANQFDTITVETNNKLKEADEKRAKEREAKRKEQASKEILNINEAAEVEENTRVKSYGKELENLQTSLRNKQISIKTYHAKRKELEESFQIEDLQSQIYYLEQQLSLASLSAEQRYKIEKELVDKKKALYDKQAGALDVPQAKKPKKEDFNFFSDVLGMSPENANKATEAFNIVASEMENFVAAEVELQQQRIDALNGYISEKENELSNELKLNELGFASNVEGKRKEIEELKKERQKAIADQRRAAQIQNAINSIEQVSNLITAAAKVMQGFSNIPIIGPVLGIIAVGAMIAAFTAMKAKAAQASQPPSFRKGGGLLLDGPTHEQKGLHLVNPNTGKKIAEYEGGEYLFAINKRSTAQALPLLEAINKGDFAGLRFPVYPQMEEMSIRPDMEVSKKVIRMQHKALRQEKQEQRQLQADLTEVKSLLSRIAGGTDNIPEEQVIQTDEGMLYLSKNKKRLVRKTKV